MCNIICYYPHTDAFNHSIDMVLIIAAGYSSSLQKLKQHIFKSIIHNPQSTIHNPQYDIEMIWLISFRLL